jgi:hypothetical protein
MQLRKQFCASLAHPRFHATGVKSPGRAKESNWLPAPQGKFSLFIRAYWPEKAILDSTWVPPKVERMA